MLRDFCGVILMVFAIGMVWSCGGERVMQSQVAEEQVGRPLSKLAVQMDALVVATVLRDGAPVIGAMVEFSRSVAGQTAEYQWSDTTDEKGQARVELGTGYYQARASIDGREIGFWSSIPVNSGYEVMLDLPISEKAQVMGSFLRISGVSNGEIPIGVVLPLTGNIGSIGTFLKNGMELAREEVNRSQFGATPIAFIIEDSESNPDVAVSAFNKLIDRDKVSVILGPGFSSSATAAFPIAQEKQVVAFSPTAGAAGLGAIGDFVFRTPSPVDKIVPSFVNNTREKLVYQKVALIFDRDDLFSQSGYEETREVLDDLGVEILTTETFQTGDTDFSEQLNRIKASNPDAIFVWTRPAERVEVPVQGRRLGISDAIPFIVFGFTSTEMEMAGTAAEGVITSAYWSLSADTPGNRAFVQNYRTKYGTDPDGWAAFGYANVQVLAAAIRDAGSVNPRAIRDALAAIDVPTILGQFSFDPNGDPTYPVIVMVVANGKLEILDTGSSVGTPDDAIKIGFIYGTYRKNSLDGATLAALQFNEDGGVRGVPIELIDGGVPIEQLAEENISETEYVAALAEKLITQEKVLAIVGPNRSSQAVIVGEIAQRHGIPMVTTNATNPIVTTAGDFVFMAAFTDDFQGKVMAEFAIQELGAGRVAVLTERGSIYSEGLSQTFVDNFGALGGHVAAHQFYMSGETDFASQLIAVTSSMPNVVFIPGSVADISLLVEQARQNFGLTATFLGGDSWHNAELLTTSGAFIEGSFFSGFFSSQVAPGDLSEDAHRFIDAYTAMFGVAPDGSAALGYDALRLVVQAMLRTEELTPMAIRDEIAATRDYSGATFISGYDENRYTTKSAVINRIANGAIEFYKLIEP